MLVLLYTTITDYFNLQPPTKLFEYAASGLYNIATATIANKNIFPQIMVF